MRPTKEKFAQTGKISPNLVTLVASDDICNLI
jgi:hypothetical protein